MSRTARLLAGMLVALAGAAEPTQVLAQQAPDAKADFVRALGGFSVALDGAYGDEGPAIRAGLEAMRQALARWDATVERYEAAMRAELPAADPPLALRMHVAIGGVYLDRGRAADAVRELTAARRIDDRRPDVHVLLGHAHRLAGDAGAALESFRRASSLPPADPVRAYVLAQHLLATGDSDAAADALVRFRSAIEASQGPSPAGGSPFVRVGLLSEVSGVEPFFPPARYADGFALLRRGDYAAAMQRFADAAAGDALLTGDPDDAAAMARAASSLREGDADAALETLHSAVASRSDRAELHRAIGIVYAADEQYDRAADALSAAIRLSPDDERARTALADVYVAQEKLDDAERTLRALLQRLPASGRARYALARVFERQGRYADALTQLRASLDQMPMLGANAIHETIANLEAAQQDYEAAADAHARRVAVHPDDAEAHHDLGATYSVLGRQGEAAAEFHAALVLDAQHVESRAALAQIYLAEARYEAAVNAARTALEAAPAHREARYALATALIRLGRTEEGQAELAHFGRLQSEDAMVRTQRFQVEGLRREAEVRSAAGAHAEAAALLERALSLAPDSGALHMDAGRALLAGGDAARAVERFSDALRLDGTPEAYRGLSDAYTALGDAGRSREARVIYQRTKQEALRRRSAAR